MNANKFAASIALLTAFAVSQPAIFAQDSDSGNAGKKGGHHAKGKAHTAKTGKKAEAGGKQAGGEEGDKTPPATPDQGADTQPQGGGESQPQE